MPRGVRRNKENISKMEGVRRALNELGHDAGNKSIQEYLESQFGIVMPTALISNYKSGLKAAAARRSATPQPAQPAVSEPAPGGITLDEIRAVKEVVDKYGAEK